MIARTTWCSVARLAGRWPGLVLSCLLCACVQLETVAVAECWNGGGDCPSPGEGPCAAARSAAVPFAGGDGSAGDPFRICTAQQLDRVGGDAAYLDAAFVLLRDVDLAELTGPVTMIGTSEDGFSGRFDGGGHAVKGLALQAVPGQPVGLFSVLSGTVHDLGVEVERVEAEAGTVGTLVGVANGASITRCHASSPIERGAEGIVISRPGPGEVGGLVGATSGDDLDGPRTRISDSWASVPIRVEGGGNPGSIGGLVGRALYTEMLRCRTQANISAPQSGVVGGLVGDCFGGPGIARCISEGQVHGSVGVGGLAGSVAGFCHVRDSYSRAAVTGQSAVGGLIGFDAGIPVVERDYAVGEVLGEQQVGGLAGRVEDLSIFRACFWSPEASPAQAGLSGLGDQTDGSGVLQRSLAELRQQGTFEEQGWDFVERWAMAPGRNDGFPLLRWQLDSPEIAGGP